VLRGHGTVAAHLRHPMSANEFKNAMMLALEVETAGKAANPKSTPGTERAETATEGPVPTQLQSTRIEQMMAERRLRLEADKKTKDAAAKLEHQKQLAAARAEKAKAQESGAPSSSQDAYAQQQRRRKQEAREAKERVLKIIEDDKKERREKEEARKQIALAVRHANGETEDEAAQQLQREARMPASRKTAECAIQVRMFDGTTIREKFPSENTIRTDVRQWIATERRDGETPYNLRQILTPLPSRQIEISEEEESLQSLGLTPSATLVMVPVKEYTEAYGDASLIGKNIAAGVSLVTDGIGAVAGIIGSFLGYGQARNNQPAQPSPASSNVASDSASRINIRTLHDQSDAKDAQQLYNGNQVCKWVYEWVGTASVNFP
jgi:hypothetical protein